MDESEFEQTVERLRAANKVIEALDPAVRSAAFEILRPYVEGAVPAGGTRRAQARPSNARQTKPKTPKRPKKAAAPKRQDTIDVDTTSAESFVRSLEPEKPAEYVYAIVAWWFSQYGSAPITRKQVESIANQIGVTIPARPDMTLAQATSENKQLFRSTSDGYIPTVPHGELYLKNEYGIQKGTESPPAEES